MPLRKDTPRALLLALIKDDGLEFSQLVKEVRTSFNSFTIFFTIVEDERSEIKTY